MMMSRYRTIYLNKVDSTNSFALRNIHNLQDRQVIVAEKQTEGHGRLNRKWISHIAGNIYLSLVLKSFHELSHLANLTQYMSIVISDVLESYNIEPELKWPNDVLVKSAKIAGILGESHFQGSNLIGYVLGAGINLNMSADDLKGIDQSATSLNLLTGTRVDKDRFLSQLLKRFFRGYNQFLIEGFPSIKKKYSARSSFLGKKIIAVTAKGRTFGIAKEFTDSGALVLLTENGDEKILTTGDIIHPIRV